MRFVLAIDTLYTDSRSGAAHSMRTMMEWLVEAGHEVRVLATARWDAGAQDIAAHLVGLGVPVTRMKPGRATGGGHVPAVEFVWHGVPVTMILTRSLDRARLDPAENAQYLRAFDALCERFRPDVMASYGGGPIVVGALRHARERGVTTLFSVRNYGQEHRVLYEHVDHVLAASDFLARYYRRSIGLRTTPLPSPIAWSEVMAPAEGRGFVTFVNPAPHKGLVVFARLAMMLGERRPDIPILVVQSVAEASLMLNELPEAQLARYPQIVASPSLTEPADIFALAKLLLVPSLFEEPFGRVAAEAMVNGVPPLVGDRGALPETVGEGGLVLPIPSWCAPDIRRLPSEAELLPWYDAVTRLWDDTESYARASAAARATAERFYGEAAQRRRYIDYFTGLPKADRNLWQ